MACWLVGRMKASLPFPIRPVTSMASAQAAGIVMTGPYLQLQVVRDRVAVRIDAE